MRYVVGLFLILVVGSPSVLAEVRVLDLASPQALSDILPELAERRVVFVGETHDRYDHHLNQLKVIQGLYERDPAIAIGVEFFQRPFQNELDDYIDGEIEVVELLRRTEYYRRWGYDFRHYAAILVFAREHDIPTIALNAPTELVRQVRRNGLAGVSEADRASLPDSIERGNSDYRERLKQVFEHHAEQGHAANFEHFYEAQLVWDETMAETAAAFLRQHPNRRMVVLAGNGHLGYGHGIPDRLRRRAEVSASIVLNGWEGPLEPGLADYVLMSETQWLPEPGRLGVYLSAEGKGVVIERFADSSHAPEAGLEAGDRITRVQGQPVDDVGDLKALLWDKEPGARVSVTVVADRLIGVGKTRTVEVLLQ